MPLPGKAKALNQYKVDWSSGVTEHIPYDHEISTMGNLLTNGYR